MTRTQAHSKIWQDSTDSIQTLIYKHAYVLTEDLTLAGMFKKKIFSS